MSSNNKNNDTRGNVIDRQNNCSQSGDNGRASTMAYVYTDRSHISPTLTDLEAMQRDRDIHHFAQRLPTKLNRMLHDTELSGVIEWMPHGRSWRIIDRDEFRARALPTYFQHSNMASFIRLVNAWGFRRVQSGVDYDSYYHECFLRGMPHLHIQMRRLLPDERKAPPEPYNDCPRFHDMPLCGGEFSGMSSSEQSVITHHHGLSSTTLASNTHHSSGSSREVVAPLFSISPTKNNSIKRKSRYTEDSVTAFNPIRTPQNIINQSNSGAPSLSTVQNSHSIRPPNYHLNGQVSFSQVKQRPTSSSISHHVHPNNSLPSIEAIGPQFAFATTDPMNPHHSSQQSHRDSQMRSRDPLVSFLANILFPRVQSFGPPRTNEDLVHLLISEWHASPDTGQDDDYQRMQQMLIARHSRPSIQQQHQRRLPSSQQDTRGQEE
mmetsp:Transcript_17997/g.37316  ORF Transcript_17997/g.37316 Transcript_17997/m.37316 type:complete len:434 (-) Transcript_17997:418-1719(-)